MALDLNATKVADLIDPEVLADFVDSKLIDAIKFSPIAKINRELQGRAGSTLSIPVYGYIGDATTVAEGGDIPIGKLTKTSDDVKITKAGRGVQLTDEDILYAYGDTVGEATNQIVTSIASKVEKDFIAKLDTIASTSPMFVDNTTTGILTGDVIADALVKFGEDFEGDKYLFVSPAQHAALIKSESWIKATDLGVQRLVRGVVGMIYGCYVIVSNRVTKSNYIVKPNALGLLIKRDTAIEMDRDIINKSTVITADKHYAVYIADASGAIRIKNQA